MDLLALEMRGDVLALLATAVDRVLPHLIRTEKLENLGLVGHKLAITWVSQRNGWEFQKTEHVAEDDEANRVVGDLQASKTAMKGTSYCRITGRSTGIKSLRCVISEKRPFTAIILCRKEKMEAFEHSAWISISTHFWMKRSKKGYITAVTELFHVEEFAVAFGDIVEGEADRLLGDSRVSFVEDAMIAMCEVMAAEMHEVEADHRETAAFIEVLHENEKKRKRGTERSSDCRRSAWFHILSSLELSRRERLTCRRTKM